MRLYPSITFLLVSVFLVDASLEEFFEKFRKRLDGLLGFTNGSDSTVSSKELRIKWDAKLNAMNSNNELGRDGVQETIRNLNHHIRKAVKEQGDNLFEVNEKVHIFENLYQGDMILTDNQIDTIIEAEERDETSSTMSRARRQAYRDRNYPRTIWGNVVYYYYDPSATPAVRSVFDKAVQFWRNNTCVEFEENRQATNRIRVFRGEGCYSYVGKVGGEQDLSLGNGCESVGTAAHELGHALGFFHMMSRHDRDQFITINVNNIGQGFVGQFDKESPSTNDNYGLTYDYGSVMHYGALSASRNRQPTIVAKDSGYQDTMGSDIVAFYDVLMMNMHYKCNERCTGSSIKCENGGYPDPRNCNVCKCPTGFAGTTCTDRPSGCGAVLTAKESYSSVSKAMGMRGSRIREDFTYCNYLIQAPPGKKVRVKVTKLASDCVDGCVYGGVEFKGKADQRLTGYSVVEAGFD